MIWVLVGICSITIGANIMLIMFWLLNFKSYPSLDSELPKVSVLLAARNEEQNIGLCLEALLALDYPTDKLEVLVGDDDSEDDTLSIIRSFEEMQIIKVVPIRQEYKNLKGKANVLAQLAHVATGDYYFMTDADIAVPKKWIRQLLGAISSDTGMVVGVTGVKGNGFQNIEWLFSLAMVKVVTDLGKPVTGIGNNMLVSKEAYQAIGGYENIPFSITEDYELFRQVRNKGYQCHHVYQPGALSVSEPILGFFKLMKQRKRWMHGAVQLPWQMVLLLFIQGAFAAAIIPLLLMAWPTGLILLSGKWVTHIMLVLLANNKVKGRLSLIHLLFYECYATAVSISSMIYYLLPVRVMWKGREY